MTAVATRPGTWREARKDLPVLGKDGHVWTLAKLVKDPSTGRPLVTMTRTIPTSGETLQPIPIERAVLVNWDDEIKVVVTEEVAADPEPPASQPVPYEPPARAAMTEPVRVTATLPVSADVLKAADEIQVIVGPIIPPAAPQTSALGNTPTGWAVPPTADWTAAELHSHSWLMHGWIEDLGPLAEGHARHEQMHAAPSGGIPHFHRSAK